MRRTERLFALSEALRARRTGITAEALAERFNVSLRTMYRDLESLRAASLPVHAERGRGGGYALDRSYALPPVNFTAREASLLVTAGRLLIDQRWMPFTDTLATALDKVESALPPRGQRDLAALRRSLSFVGVPARSCEQEVREVIESAWIEQRPLRIRYDGARGEADRTVRIRSVVMERTETLLNCDDLDKGAPRQFILHRIEAATVERG